MSVVKNRKNTLLMALFIHSRLDTGLGIVITRENCSLKALVFDSDRVFLCISSTVCFDMYIAGITGRFLRTACLHLSWRVAV